MSQLSKGPSKFLVLDYGSQYTQLITRRLRELGFYSMILPGSQTLERIQSENPTAVILSGGPSSVYETGAPQLPHGFLDWQRDAKIPVLGICYGMQLLAKDLGGEVKAGTVREYGRTTLGIQSGVHPLQELAGSAAGDGAKFRVWMSHGDHVARLPSGFESIAASESGLLAAAYGRDRRILMLQFHPEVVHTEHGAEILRAFAEGLCAKSPDWKMGSFQREELDRVRRTVGDTAHVVCALSGGVDSAVAATLVHRAIGNRLHCVFVDHGLLRFEERARVVKLFTEDLKLPVKVVDAESRFLNLLAGVSDPEQKRKIIGAQFIREFETASLAIAQEVGVEPEFLVQGTLYPDVIESSGSGHSATIKSHHNVGGLPKDLKFKLIEPLRLLFKDEVRALGKELGVPDSFLKRHPFPGPGLAVRILGEVTAERAGLLRRVDEIFIQSLRDAGLYDQIWQAFAVLLPVKSVGVQGDGRTHDPVVALRAVTSSDGMTADWYRFDGKFLADVSNRISNQVRGVGRVVYDISSKPPATIEWE